MVDDPEAGPAGDTIEELIVLVELQHGLLTSVATGGPPINTVDRLYKQRRERLRRGLGSLGLKDPFPWSSLWDWYGFWGTLGGYAPRRVYIERLAEDILQDLRARRDSTSVVDWGEGTVDGLEHRVDGLKSTLESARDLDDFQDVGRRSREILIDLANLAYDSSMAPSGREAPGRNDAKAMLELFFDQQFSGPANEEMRRFMKAAVGLANSVTHSDDSADVHAFAVAQATVLLVRVVSKLRRSVPDPAEDKSDWPAWMR
jgi:hypothetical protein